MGLLLKLLLKDCPAWTDWLGVLLSVIFLLEAASVTPVVPVSYRSSLTLMVDVVVT